MPNDIGQRFLDMLSAGEIGGREAFGFKAPKTNFTGSQGRDFSQALVTPEFTGSEQQTDRERLMQIARSAPAFSEQYFDTLGKLNLLFDENGLERANAPESIAPPPYTYDQQGNRIGIAGASNNNGGNGGFDINQPGSASSSPDRLGFLRSFFGGNG